MEPLLKDTSEVHVRKDTKTGPLLCTNQPLKYGHLSTFSWPSGVHNRCIGRCIIET